MDLNENMSILNLEVDSDEIKEGKQITCNYQLLQETKHIKFSSKQVKKERKLLLAFSQKFLPLDIPTSIIDEKLQKNGLPQLNCRNVLIDNRNLQLKFQTETLWNHIEAQNVFIEDMFVMPNKKYILVQFQTNVDAQKFKYDLFTDGSDFHEFTRIELSVFISDKLFSLIVKLFQPEIDRLIERFNKNAYPDRLDIRENFITVEEERRLLSFSEQLFSTYSDQYVSHLKNRESVHYGHVFDYTLNTISDQTNVSIIDNNIPEECNFLLKRFVDLIPELPDQLTINRYRSNMQDHIPPHVDTHSMCTEWIISVSLGSDVVMQFTKPRFDDGKDENEYTTKMVLLRNRSMLLMCDEARYRWCHAIQQTGFDIRPFDWSAINQTRAHRNRLSLSPRDLRYSFTFRKVRPPGYQCKCSYPESCDSQTISLYKKNDLSKEIDVDKAIQLEKEFVHQTYDQIAEHFSATRYGQWPSVTQFMNSLPTGSLILDIGCGNGKYLSVRGESNCNYVIGTDCSRNLLNICMDRGFETFQDNCLNIGTTVREGIFDAAICIAVIHHLATEERRLDALRSIVRLIRIGGRALIYVWAFEQKRDGLASKYLKSANSSTTIEKDESKETLSIHKNRTEFKKQDLFVPWKKSGTKMVENQTKLRFYHVFRENELENLIRKLSDSVKLEQIYYDQGNWCAIIQKC